MIDGVDEDEFFAAVTRHGPLEAVAAAFGGRLGEFAYDPGLVAAVDQHAAAVRDTVGTDRETVGDYVLGFTDALRDLAWRVPAGYDFAALRLTAVSWLIREYGL
jgi:hypothetical protein